MHDLIRPSRKLLLVSYHFPPYNAIAAVRTGKMARHFVDIGWDVRVLAARPEAPATLPTEVEPSIVTRTSQSDVIAKSQQVKQAIANESPQSLRKRLEKSTRDSVSKRLSQGARSRLSNVKAAMLRWPDIHAGWRHPAVRAGATILADWRPDMIYASAPPVTSLLIADDISRRYGIPWVAELRDLWVDDPYYPFGPLRRSIERVWERRVIGRAAALVTVSDVWQDMLRRRFKKPVALVMNGYDPADFPTSARAPDPGGPLRVLHTGHIYVGYRDPTPLFRAIAMLGPERNDIIVEFVGTNGEGIAGLARAAGVEDRVIVRPPIPYKDSLASQMNADVLLHLQWDDPKEAGTIGGKLFEYLGARRPVLCVGYESGSVAQIVGERKAGLVSNDPSVIAGQLRRWVSEKRSGGISALPEAAAAGLTRAEQFAKLEEFLLPLMPEKPSTRPRASAKSAADPIGLRRSRHYQVADTTSVEAPVLTVIIDTEEEFDWRKPYSRSNRDVQALHGLEKAQRVFRKWGIVPTYVADYPVVESPIGRRLIGGWLDAGECEIGAHLHPWVNPPIEEEVGDRNSFPGNLPEDLERAKLTALTEAIKHSFGRRPLIYRAGRYGLGPNSPAILEDLGYLVDLSIVPFTSFAALQGPDFTDFGSEPFWFGERRRLLELPVTRGFVGLMRQANVKWFDKLDRSIQRRLWVAGALARTGLLERITLTPEGIACGDMRRLCESLIGAGRRVFTFSFHSPSLVPGNTEYVRSDLDLVAFLETMDAFFKYFHHSLRGAFASPLQIYKMLDRALTDNPAPRG